MACARYEDVPLQRRPEYARSSTCRVVHARRPIASRRPVAVVLSHPQRTAQAVWVARPVESAHQALESWSGGDVNLQGKRTMDPTAPPFQRTSSENQNHSVLQPQWARAPQSTLPKLYRVHAPDRTRTMCVFEGRILLHDAAHTFLTTGAHIPR